MHILLYIIYTYIQGKCIYICKYTFVRVTMPYTPTSFRLPSLWPQVLWPGSSSDPYPSETCEGHILSLVMLVLVPLSIIMKGNASSTWGRKPTEFGISVIKFSNIAKNGGFWKPKRKCRQQARGRRFQKTTRVQCFPNCWSASTII